MAYKVRGALYRSLIGDKIIPLKNVDEQFEEIDKEPSVWMGLYYN